jgi:hypothetical protein
MSALFLTLVAEGKFDKVCFRAKSICPVDRFCSEGFWPQVLNSSQLNHGEANINHLCTIIIATVFYD